MRRLFVTIMILYLLISFVGIVSVSTRLIKIKEKTESLTEAQRSLIKRAEFKDLIFETRRAIEEKRDDPEILLLIDRTKVKIKECYSCHHPDHIITIIRDTEKAVNALVSPAMEKDYATLLNITGKITPFVKRAFERATSLSETRLESAVKEINRTERVMTITAIAGILLFLTLSIIALYRVSLLQSRIKERERSLENWAKQWQQTFDSIQDCLMILDRDSNLKMTNKSAKETFGEVIIGYPFMEMLGVPSVKNIHDLCNSKGGIEFTKGDRVYHIKSYHLHLDYDEDFIVVIRDVTSEKEMEQRLIQAEKLSALSRTMATVATELHNPLTSVSKYSEVLLDLSTINKRIREIADKISISTSRMSGIVGELLLFSRSPILNKTPVNFKSLIEEIFKLIKEGMDMRKINLIAESEDVTITADKTKIERALLSLITNSINRINRSGKGDRVEIRGYKEKGLFHIHICDNGPFIPKEISLRLFEPFFTDSVFNTQEVRKSGLNLSMSYNIIRAHNGDIVVKSTEDETVFSIELPSG
ncbi:MAG: ATP-binding protein [Thermodesulfovibrionales bacterium]